MNFIGVKDLKYAKLIKDDETGVEYGEIKTIKGLTKISVEPSSSEATFYGDNTALESVKRLSGIKVAIETASLPLEVQADLFGHEYDKSTNRMICKAEDAAPYIGIMYTRNKVDNTERIVKVYKVMFGLNNDNATTGGENIEFQQDAVEGTAVPLQYNGQWKDMMEENGTNSSEITKFKSEIIETV